MNTETILRLLRNSGFNVRGVDSTFIYLEDPSCILRSFATFTEYVWIILSVITMVLLFGWGISLIRGAKNDWMTNLRNLLIMFATLSIAGPILNVIYGDDLFGQGCRTIKIKLSEVNTMLDARNAQLKKYNPNDLYEELNIYDSGVIDAGTTYADAPLAGGGTPVRITSDTDSKTPAPFESNGRFGGGTQSMYNYADNSPDDITRNSGTSVRTTTSSTNIPGHRAYGEAGTRDVIYVANDGTKYRRAGGTRAWRNKNPGNLRYSEFSRRMGAIGEAGGFAVFPDEETGMRAISSLMRTETYSQLTIAGAISRYAPPSENNTAGYHRRIRELTGLSINRRVGDLNDEEIARIASAIRTIEGWKVGETTQI